MSGGGPTGRLRWRTSQRAWPLTSCRPTCGSATWKRHRAGRKAGADLLTIAGGFGRDLVRRGNWIQISQSDAANFAALSAEFSETGDATLITSDGRLLPGRCHEVGAERRRLSVQLTSRASATRPEFSCRPHRRCGRPRQRDFGPSRTPDRRGRRICRPCWRSPVVFREKAARSLAVAPRVRLPLKPSSPPCVQPLSVRSLPHPGQDRRTAPDLTPPMRGNRRGVRA